MATLHHFTLGELLVLTFTDSECQKTGAKQTVIVHMTALQGHIRQAKST